MAINEQELNELLNQYSERFGEPFLRKPEYLTDEQITDGIRKCLANGKPRPQDYDHDNVY